MAPTGQTGQRLNEEQSDSDPVGVYPWIVAVFERMHENKFNPFRIPGFGETEMAKDFTGVKDSGKRQDFDTGSKRDTQDGKPRYDLIPIHPMHRLAMHYANGAVKYGDRNWEKGQPMSRYFASAERHLAAAKAGKTDEDHLAAVAWNIFGIIATEKWIEDGRLPRDLDDMHVFEGPTPPIQDEPKVDPRFYEAGQYITDGDTIAVVQGRNMRMPHMIRASVTSAGKEPGALHLVYGYQLTMATPACWKLCDWKGQLLQ
jgi:hypothetical protein